MPERRIKLSWKQLEEILQKAEVIFREEEIREMTLVKPKELLIYPRKKT